MGRMRACNIEVPEWHRLSGKLRDYVSHYIEGAKPRDTEAKPMLIGNCIACPQGAIFIKKEGLFLWKEQWKTSLIKFPPGSKHECKQRSSRAFRNADWSGKECVERMRADGCQ
eukprot:scaffold38082_cov17-Tisochrysis_lutea.AAC.1